MQLLFRHDKSRQMFSHYDLYNMTSKYKLLHNIIRMHYNLAPMKISSPLKTSKLSHSLMISCLFYSCLIQSNMCYLIKDIACSYLSLLSKSKHVQNGKIFKRSVTGWVWISLERFLLLFRLSNKLKCQKQLKTEKKDPFYSSRAKAGTFKQDFGDHTLRKPWGQKLILFI